MGLSSTVFTEHRPVALISGRRLRLSLQLCLTAGCPFRHPRPSCSGPCVMKLSALQSHPITGEKGGLFPIREQFVVLRVIKYSLSVSPWEWEGWVLFTAYPLPLSWVPRVHLRMVELEETLRSKSLPPTHCRKPSLVILMTATVTS